MNLIVRPFYVNFREAHAVAGTFPPEYNVLGTQDAENVQMNNAWFTGIPGSTITRVRKALEGEGEGEVAEIETTDEAGRGCRRVFPCWKRPYVDSAADVTFGLGNAAFPQLDTSNDEEELEEYEKKSKREGKDHGSWKGYPHDAAACKGCQARLRVKRQLEREDFAERERERRFHEELFASVGLGLDQEADEDEDASSSTDSYDTLLDELEPVSESFTSDDGITYPGLPRTLDRSKLAHGECNGIREIYLVGKTEGRHRDAWGGYDFYGRVREWDGLIGVVRKPRGNEDGTVGEYLFLYGYLVGGENWVGNWRFTGVDAGIIGYEGAFVMSRRSD